MQKINWKYTSYFTILLIFIYIVSSAMPLPVLVERAEASSIDSKSLLVGLGLALVLISLTRNDRDSGASAEVDLDDRQGDYTDDEDLLARVIHAEARGEPYKGQVAVGAVVLNRVEDPEFPSSISGAVYQDGQFTSVKNGQIHLSPDKTAYRAAREALDGKDPSQGALYFYNPDKAKTLWWLSSRTETTRIGSHIFAR